MKSIRSWISGRSLTLSKFCRLKVKAAELLNLFRENLYLRAEMFYLLIFAGKQHLIIRYQSVQVRYLLFKLRIISLKLEIERIIHKWL